MLRGVTFTIERGESVALVSVFHPSFIRNVRLIRVQRIERQWEELRGTAHQPVLRPERGANHV